MGRDPELPKHALMGVHVLVVEQDRETAGLLSKILTHCGALVSVVPSAAAEHVLRAGFDAHVLRPLDPWELCAVVAGVARRLS